VPLTQRQLNDYQDWLHARGLATSTQRQYCRQVRLAHAEKDLFSRLRGDLSPKAKRLCKASLLSWARHTGDQELRDRLEDFRLPPARRIKPKRVFSKEQFRDFQAEVDGVDTPALRAVVGLMARRGMRRGDVLRLRREEIIVALDTELLVHEAKGSKYLEFGVTRAFRPYLEILADIPRRSWRKPRVCQLISPVETSAGNRIGRLVSSLGDAIGFEGAHPHLLRSTYATYAYQAFGRDLVALQEHMQWSNLETARQYVVQHNRKELDQVAERMFDDDDGA
jgi:integrase